MIDTEEANSSEQPTESSTGGGDIEGRDEQEEISEEEKFQQRVTHAFTELGKDPEADHFLATYTRTLEIADQSLPLIEGALSNLHGAQLIPEVARANLTKQLNLYLLAGYDLARYHTATVSRFGKYKSYNAQEAPGNPLEIIEMEMERISQDFEQLSLVPPTLEAFAREGLPLIDKYLFDQGRQEDLRHIKLNTLVLEDIQRQPHGELLTQQLQREGILPAEEEAIEIEMDDPHTFELSSIATSYLDGMVLKTGMINGRSGGTIPDMIVIPISSDLDTFFDKNNAYQTVLSKSYSVTPDKRPIIIFYSSDGQIPLLAKSFLQDNLFCESFDDLRSTMQLAKALKSAKTKPPLVEPAVLAQLQEQQYDASTDLREWEHETADTYQSLKSFLGRLNERQEAYFKKNRTGLGRIVPSDNSPNNPRQVPDIIWEKNTEPMPKDLPYLTDNILDIGTGDGRIGGMLARLGYRVVGIDISQEQLNRGKQRLIEEGEGLRGERLDPKLSYNALLKLEAEGALPQRRKIITDDTKAQNNYVTAKGNFLNLHNTLVELATRWYRDHPRLNRDLFMFAEELYPISGEPMIDVAFDAAFMGWHTFNEISDIEDRRIFLRNVFESLMPGAEFTIEIPDRSVDPYASVIADYYRNHPDEPYGTHRLQSEDGTEYSPRSFPDRSEMVLLLQAVGFEIDPEDDIETYLVTKPGVEDGSEELKVKELVIRARKPSS